MELFVLDYLHSQYFWTTLAFLILLGVIYKFVVPSVLAVLDARAAQIAADLDAAERGRVQAEGTLAEYAAQLAQAKKDAGEIVSRARAESEALANERIKQVEAELGRKAEDARKSIEAARDEAMRNVQKDIAEIAVQVASKLLDQSVDAKVASNLTDKALAKGLN
ncbi:MAG: ATP synthase F0 subunit B [Alphaproteobacteria bacterium]|nr:MAG: ATP synthase F0 subunit B [Alphaproteobacteria bacterium]